MDQSADMVLRLNKGANDLIVHASGAAQKSQRHKVVYLGSKDLQQVQEFERKGFVLIQTLNTKVLIKLLTSWDTCENGILHAIIIDEKFLPTLLLEDLASIRESGALSNVPFFAFAKKKNKLALSAINSLQIDDYEPYPIQIEPLIAKINVFHTLKKSGISTWGFSEEREFEGTFKKTTWAQKRLFDIIIATLGLILAAPLMMLTILAIKMESKGPVFYISKRAGKNYSVFDFYKLRSMHVDAEERLAELKARNQYKDGNQFVKIKNDPRITRVGRFIRSTSIDEIPQLINVLKGDMSIVGNRPLPLYEAEQLTVDDHAERFLAPAGITGLWQVLKRGKEEMSSEERILLDRIYVRKNSLLFDLKLIVMTIPAIFQKETV
ncbi:MAG: hypothetical protein Tsb0034_13450 [Ekhidna sp.]